MRWLNLLLSGQISLIAGVCLILSGCSSTTKNVAKDRSRVVVHGGLTQLFEGNPESVVLENHEGDAFISAFKEELEGLKQAATPSEDFGDGRKLSTNTWLSISLPSCDEDVLLLEDKYVRYGGRWYSHDTTQFYKFTIEFICKQKKHSLSQASRYSPYISEVRREELIRELVAKHSGGQGKKIDTK